MGSARNIRKARPLPGDHRIRRLRQLYLSFRQDPAVHRHQVSFNTTPQAHRCMRCQLRHHKSTQSNPHLRHQHDILRADGSGQAGKGRQRLAAEHDQHRPSAVVASEGEQRSLQRGVAAQSASAERLEECKGVAAGGEAIPGEVRDVAGRRSGFEGRAAREPVVMTDLAQ